MNKSDGIIPHHFTTFVLKGFLYYFNAQLTEAHDNFQSSID